MYNLSRTPPSTPTEPLNIQNSADKRSFDTVDAADEQQDVRQNHQIPKKPCTRLSPSVCYVCKYPCVNDNITCTECQYNMHLTCVGMSKSFYDYFIVKLKKPYECPSCSTRTIDTIKSKASEFEKQLGRLQTDLVNFQSKISTHDSQIASMSTQMTILAKTVAETSDMNDQKLNLLSNKIDTQDEKLAKEICYIQGLQKKDELLISGVPSQPQENLKLIVIKIAAYVTINLNSDGIKKIHRLAASTTTNNTTVNPPILVKFATTDLRNALNDRYITLLKEKKPLNLSNIGLQGQDRIYINAHLPQCLTEVYKAAIQLKKDGKIQAYNSKTTSVAIKMWDKWHKIQTMGQLTSIMNQGRPLA